MNQFKKMSQEEAETIANWKYEGIYSFYDKDLITEDLQEFLNEDSRGERYFSIYEHNELVGFLSVSSLNTQVCVIGLGMRPDLTNQGRGVAFIKDIINFIKKNFNYDRIELSVATFNKRAIKVYRTIGFEHVKFYNAKILEKIYPFETLVIDL